ncbi:MAG: HypC/HybG/HupF family hydrogenase formation chaperone [Clostridia bacterium]|nr:HypC/HybG/HupF family hydrogenase formation chaperone [Clostridia bacterium]
MCVAAPGKVIKIENSIATVDFSGNLVRAHAGLLDIRQGDNVLVHAGLIIQKLSPKEAEDMTKLFEELEEISNE